MKIAFTGHRPEAFKNVQKEEEDFYKNLDIFLLDVMYGKTYSFIIGGCRGVDHWAAKYAFDHNIEFDLYLPFPFNIYTSKWNDNDKNFLKKQIDHCQEIKMFSRDYDVKYYIIRDHSMVDNGQILVSWFLHNKQRSGTGATINYAKKVGKKVYYLRDMEV